MSQSKLPAVDLGRLESHFSQLQLQGVRYSYGAKAPSLGCAPENIARLDCSGAVRYLLFKGTAGALIAPDGSQNQRVWCEEMGLHRLARYSDVTYATPRRLFICFIKPFVNGCGSVGHVWLVSQLDADKDTQPDTMESHSGVGIDSRPWNTRVLKREAYVAYELPVSGAAPKIH